MTQTTTTGDAADDEPLPDHAAERQAIRDRLAADIRVLTYYGSEPMIALVNRDRAPSTGNPSVGETVVLVEWHGGDDYAVSVAEGDRTGWTLTDELVSEHDTRAEALEAVAGLFADTQE